MGWAGKLQYLLGPLDKSPQSGTLSEAEATEILYVITGRKQTASRELVSRQLGCLSKRCGQSLSLSLSLSFPLPLPTSLSLFTVSLPLSFSHLSLSVLLCPSFSLPLPLSKSPICSLAPFPPTLPFLLGLSHG